MGDRSPSDGLAARLIGLDWGTTSFRAYLIAEGGAVIDSIASADGILSVQGGEFEGAFKRLLAPWLADQPSLPIIASGMITSRNGWLETPYLDTPAQAHDFAQALRPTVTAAGHRVNFVTGLAVEDAAGAPDVMRGEETEILGHMAGLNQDAAGLDQATPGPGAYIVPGTHSKWVETSGGALTGFRTFMTGEVFSVLKNHSILSRLTADGPFSEASFTRGAQIGLAEGGALLHKLFAARTLPLFERLTPVEASNYLSGLLIGSEVAAGLAQSPSSAATTVIGQDTLAARYVKVLSLAGIQAHRAEQAMVARGHWEIATMAELTT